MKDAVEAIDKVFSHLGTILRYIAPGFAALFVVAAVIPDKRPFLSSASPSVIVLGILLGPTIYAVHTGAVVRVFWLPPILFLRVRKCKGIWKEIRDLALQRWIRRASEDKEIRSIQDAMDEWGAMLNFLYCLSYVMISIPALAKLSQRWVVSSNWWIILLLGFGFLLAAFISEYRIDGMEIELKNRYPDGRRPNR